MSFQTFIERFKSLVFEKIELEYQDIPTLKALMTLWVNQYFNSDVENKFYAVEKRVVCLTKKLPIDTLIEK